jgi:hypothetical protein
MSQAALKDTSVDVFEKKQEWWWVFTMENMSICHLNRWHSAEKLT